MYIYIDIYVYVYIYIYMCVCMYKTRIAEYSDDWRRVQLKKVKMESKFFRTD